MGDDDAASRAARDLFLVARQHIGRAAADGAQPQQSNFDRIQF